MTYVNKARPYKSSLMKLCAPVPVFGRFPLVRMTISRLKAQDVIPIMLGHEDEAETIAKELDVEFIIQFLFISNLRILILVIDVVIFQLVKPWVMNGCHCRCFPAYAKMKLKPL